MRVTEWLAARRGALVYGWLRHCEAVGHVPADQGGTATYEVDGGGDHISCCECEWADDGLPLLAGARPS